MKISIRLVSTGWITNDAEKMSEDIHIEEINKMNAI